MNTMYRVIFNGEYDLDENGNVYTVYRDCETYDEACEYADAWERDTHNIATVTRIDA